MVPDAEPRSYYGRPILQEPVWKWPIPSYLFTGGLAGAAATMSGLALASGRRELSRVAGGVSAVALAASPPLLIIDLGRPARFFNMLRVVRPSSPMNVGSWLLAAMGPAGIGATLSELTGFMPRLGRAARVVATACGPLLSTYTAVLVADTAVPAWHGAHRELPVVFAASATASAGGAVTAVARPAIAGPARRQAVVGALAEVAATRWMHARLGALARPAGSERSRRMTHLASAASLAGAALIAAAGQRRGRAVLGGTLVTVGAALERFAIMQLGRESAADPLATVEPQRERLRSAAGGEVGDGHGAHRPAVSGAAARGS